MTGPAFLEGENVTLRPIERDDLAFVRRYMNDPAVWRPALGALPNNADLVEEWYDSVVTQEEDVHCLACDGDTRLGHVSLTGTQYGPTDTSRSRSMELAYWLAPDYHGQGYGSDAASRMIQYGFEDLNLRRIEAACGSFNEASAGLLESLGFEREGCQREAAWFRGEYHDMYWYGLLREEWRED